MFFVGLMLGVRLLLEPLLQSRVYYGFFYIAVILTGWKAGAPQVFAAAILGYLAAEWFFLTPRSFEIQDAVGWTSTGIYFFVSLAIVWLVKSTRAAESQALTKAVEARRMLEELKQSQGMQEFLANIVQSAQDAIISVTDRDRIASWNPAAEKLLGFSASEAIGQPLALILSAGYQREEQVIWDRVSRGEPVSLWETAFNGKNGSSIPVSLTISPVKDRSGKFIGASVVARSKAPAANASSA